MELFKIMKNNYKFRVGEEVRLNVDVKDAYGETYLSRNTNIKIEDVDPKKEGYEYGIPHGFYVGEQYLEKLPNAKWQILLLEMNSVENALDKFIKISSEVPQLKSRAKNLKNYFKKEKIDLTRKLK
jgi:hypothetical protein